MLGGSSLGPAYDVLLTKREDIDAMVGWLDQIDWWSARARDLSNADLPRVGSITIDKADGDSQLLMLYRGSVFIHQWEWPADTDALAAIAERAGGGR